jgi:glycosyltransferase domain-containing protein
MLGIVTATKNRSEFVIRGLKYYASVKCPYTIYIGDSSDLEHRDNTLAIIDKLKEKLNIVYRYYPNTNGPVAMKKLAEIVSEKYVAWFGDDDFLIPNSLSKCVEFLELNPDYATAQGDGIVFVLDRSGAYGNIQSLGPYPLRDNQYEKPSERLLNFMENYWVTEFSVHRTKDFVEDSDSMEAMVDPGFSEVLRCCMSNIQGKSQKLDGLYLLRQVHDQRYVVPGFLDEITQPGWQPTYQVVHERLTKALVEKEKMNLEVASSIATKALHLRLTASVRRSYSLLSHSAEPGRPPVLREFAKRIPYLLRAYRKLKPVTLLDGFPISYEKDLGPINDIITGDSSKL